MAGPITVNFPMHFLACEEVRAFIMELEALNYNKFEAIAHAFLLILDFAAQQKRIRIIGDATADLATDSVVKLITSAAEWKGHPADFIRCALASRMLTVEKEGDLTGIACPIFVRYNEHLLPGFVSFHKKGQMAAQRKREMQQDPMSAKQQVGIIKAQQVLDLGELAPGTSDAAIESGVMLIMQIDRAGGMAMRTTKDYGAWMIAAAIRILDETDAKAIARLLEFLYEARIDPTVPKGAEQVLQQIPQLLERSSL